MIEQPDIRPVAESGEIYRLFAPYTFEFKGVAVTVPAGFSYDGASVPRFFWTLLGLLPDGVQRAGALAHDFLYENRGCLFGDQPASRVPLLFYKRKEVDQQFRRMLKLAGMKSWHVALAYAAVRVGGYFYWRN